VPQSRFCYSLDQHRAAQQREMRRALRAVCSGDTTAELSVFTDDEGAHVMRSDAGLGLRFTDVSGASSADLPCYEEWVIVA
jgi:hypothetical protein